MEEGSLLRSEVEYPYELRVSLVRGTAHVDHGDQEPANTNCNEGSSRAVDVFDAEHCKHLCNGSEYGNLEAMHGELVGAHGEAEVSRGTCVWLTIDGW